MAVRKYNKPKWFVFLSIVNRWDLPLRHSSSGNGMPQSKYLFHVASVFKLLWFGCVNFLQTNYMTLNHCAQLSDYNITVCWAETKSKGMQPTQVWLVYLTCEIRNGLYWENSLNWPTLLHDHKLFCERIILRKYFHFRLIKGVLSLSCRPKTRGWLWRFKQGRTVQKPIRLGRAQLWIQESKQKPSRSWFMLRCTDMYK